MRRIKQDSVWFEGRNARVFKARETHLCDYGCDPVDQPRFLGSIRRGMLYAYLSTGLKVCPAHIDPDDIVSVPTPSEA